MSSATLGLPEAKKIRNARPSNTFFNQTPQKEITNTVMRKQSLTDHFGKKDAERLYTMLK
jgi:hypothetical protein